MGAAAVAVRAVHVPQPTGSGVVASVLARPKPSTLATVLRGAGVSQSALADACDVSQSRVAQWCDPSNDAAPNLRHIHAMPRSVRHAIGEALLDGAPVVPVPEARWTTTLLAVTGRIAGIATRIEEARQTGDRRELLAALREIHAAREDLARLEAGVRAAMGAP